MADKFLVQIDGVRQVTRALQLMDSGAKSRCHAAVDASLDEAAGQAQARVPKRSGELAATIRKRILSDAPVGWLMAGFGSLKRRSRAKTKDGKKKAKQRARPVGPIEPGIYAMVVEFGDARRNKPAEPYITPAIEATRPHHNARIAAALKGAAAAAESGT